MGFIELNDIQKIYPNGVQAVFDFNLSIDEKEFIVLVGPSGCGKSTTLRMVAGLEDISDGEFYIDGQLTNDISPRNRDIAMVFQNYALYPHMSVYENMAFGLKNRKIDKEEIDQRILAAADILGLKNYLNRKPKELSGGQCQRVALGRAIVRQAKVFLMDEPLSNLDAKLRVQMRTEIIRLHEKIGATTIYVTHDQTEAMTMADRIVVMKDGYIQQIGTPKEIYLHPVNKFVAGFIGSPSMNFIEVEYENGRVTLGKDVIVLNEKIQTALADYNGRRVLLGIRPEDINLSNPDVENAINVSTDVVEMLGDVLFVHCDGENYSLTAKVSSKVDVPSHSNISLLFDFDSIHFFDIESEKTIY